MPPRPPRRPADPYEWDVFLSYPRRAAVHRWVTQVLRPLVEEGLEVVGLGRAPRIFKDDEVIEAGQLWPDTLSRAHARSRVVLAVLSFPYFESAWCCAEWKNAVERRKSPRSVVVPVRFNDVEPETVAALPRPWRTQVGAHQRVDLQRFTALENPRSDTALGIELRETVQRFCELSLKPAILDAPPWSDAWPTLPVEPVIRSRPAFRSRLERP